MYALVFLAFVLLFAIGAAKLLALYSTASLALMVPTCLVACSLFDDEMVQVSLIMLFGLIGICLLYVKAPKPTNEAKHGGTIFSTPST